jgi:hypothetical protein
MALTNKEAILAPFNFEVPDNLVEKAMIDRGVKGSANYTAANTEAIELTTADICLLLVNAASESEGSNYSITYDSAKLMDLRAALLRKHGVEDEESYVGGKISKKTPW